MSYDAISGKVSMRKYTAIDLYKSISEGLIKSILRCMGTSLSFSALFSKGDNFRDFLFLI